MLKIAIIYIPGSGGSFLRRALSLSCNSIVEFPNENIDVRQKFLMFNNWNSAGWKPSELLYRPGYKTTKLLEFVQFEKSELDLVDAWHPTEFLEHDDTEVCWETGCWPNIVFLHVDPDHAEFFLKNQKTKSYYLDWDKELTSFNKLRARYQDRAIDLNFDELLNEEKFTNWVKQVDQKLQLNLDLNLVNQLWNSWYSKSKLTWQL